MKKKARLSSQAKLSKNVQYETPITLYGTAIVKKNCSIGAYTFINSNTTIYPGTDIGRYCSIAKNCEIAAFDHPIDWLSTSPFQYNMKLHFPQHVKECHQIKPERPSTTYIGNDVWIGASCIIKRGISIGNGAIIAGGATVIDSVPPYAIVGGVPAKILKYRFDKKTISKLISLKWWELSADALDAVQFNDIHKAIEQIEALKKPSKSLKTPRKKETISQLQQTIDAQMTQPKDSEPFMSFEEIKEIISMQLEDADIKQTVVNAILSKNKDMCRDYDQDEHTDQIILTHKIEAVKEIIFADKSYISKKVLSRQGYKKIRKVLKDKH